MHTPQRGTVKFICWLAQRKCKSGAPRREPSKTGGRRPPRKCVRAANWHLGRRPLRRREKEKRARFIVPLRGGSWREHNAAGVGNGGGGNQEAEGNGGGGKPGRERGASQGAETGVLGGGAKFAGTCPLVQVILAGASERRGCTQPSGSRSAEPECQL